jgi:hypothetical protein
MERKEKKSNHNNAKVSNLCFNSDFAWRCLWNLKTRGARKAITQNTSFRGALQLKRKDYARCVEMPKDNEKCFSRKNRTRKFFKTNYFLNARRMIFVCEKLKRAQ